MPVVGVPTLDALAWRQRPFKGLVCPFVDARRGEVYFCTYEESPGGIRRLGEYSVGSPSRMVAEVSRSVESGYRESGVLLAGPAALLDAAGVDVSALDGARLAPPERAHPVPGAVATLALERLGKEEAGGAASLRPIYVRKSDAELRRT